VGDRALPAASFATTPVVQVQEPLLSTRTAKTDRCWPADLLECCPHELIATSGWKFEPKLGGCLTDPVIGDPIGVAQREGNDDVDNDVVCPVLAKWYGTCPEPREELPTGSCRDQPLEDVGKEPAVSCGKETSEVQ